MSEYTTKQGDMVDAICSQKYGDESGYVEAILRVNPGLADEGLVLPAGVLIELPEINAQLTPQAKSLWD